MGTTALGRIKHQDHGTKVKSLILKSNRYAFASWLYRCVCCQRLVSFLSLWFLFSVYSQHCSCPTVMPTAWPFSHTKQFSNTSRVPYSFTQF